jgi:sugar transferase EpsL
LKRFFDLLVAALLLILSAPMLLFIVLLIRFDMGSPVFFRQQRPGLHGEPFILYKFRTMNQAMDAEGRLLPDAERLTLLGAGLRRTSLDELPQLINVLRGELSLVGPRPLLMEYLPLYSPEQRRRLDVLPGITGWAQVNGRNSLSWEDRFALDVWYVDHQSFFMDLKILWMTLSKVWRQEGISQQGHVTMEKFQGSPRRGDGYE